jgi:uncharacterized protein
MNENHFQTIAAELSLAETGVRAVALLLDEGATVPFIARYRKEATGSLDEVAITGIRDGLNRLEELDHRREAILKSLEQHGHLTDDLKAQVLGAPTLSLLEDIYLPYRPKRRTRATVAREKGLLPLATLLLEQSGTDPAAAASAYVDPEKGVATVDEALSGARDILAEMVNEDPAARSGMRSLFASRGVIKSAVAAGKETEGAKYRDYFDWQEPVSTVASHRMLAMRRGEREDILNLTIEPPEEEALSILEGLWIKGDGEDSRQVRLAVQDGYKRLLSRSMETEIRLAAKERADAEAIRVFAENLRQLLLAPPLGAKRVMGIDPGFRTGCKVVCLDRQGKLLHHEAVFPHLSDAQTRAAEQSIRKLCRQFEIEAIAVGNGTAGRETEAFLKKMDLPDRVPVIMVNESGASIYSASEVAREEFPDHDLTVRGAVSIGRRMMDPLSELVKLDPKSIGVGQYQHDVDQAALKQSLDDGVVSCVNAVGVELNRASAQLLTYVSGLGPQLARNIVSFRDENGPFRSRDALKKVHRLGPKAFEQSAGFLRVREGVNPLDASAVHPESYPVVEAMAADLGCTVGELMADPKLQARIDLNRYVSETVGLPTLRDILRELAKPGRDPRETFEAFAFEGSVQKIEDLLPGMKLPGIVTNVTAFGAFVDVGVHQDGLVHISEMSDRFVKDPSQVVKVQQKVTVTVLDVDLERKRISLSMKSAPTNPGVRNAESGMRNRPAPEKRPEPDRAPRRPAGPAKGKKEPAPFNNPFADAFKKK